MTSVTNYYSKLAADYSKLETVSPELSKKLINDFEKYISLREKAFPEISPEYSLEQIESENKEWWTARCEAIQKNKCELLAYENAEHFVYLCKGGPFTGQAAGEVGAKWWSILSQPGKTLLWPIVMFHGEVVYFSWKCLDLETNETGAQGNVTYLRRGHRGGCYVKTEDLTFYSDIIYPSLHSN
jgi:hypothetical protein